MATIASVLSILVTANTGEATSKLSTFDRQLEQTRAKTRQALQAKLGANFDSAAFAKYEATLSRTQRRVEDRKAFRAELGGAFNASAFNAYEREVARTQLAQQRLKTSSGETSGTLNAVGEKAGGITGKIRSLAGATIGLAAAFISVEAAKGAIETTLELGHSTERLAAVTGMDAKTASSWIEVMKIRGVQTKQVNMGFITLARNIRTAQDASAKHAQQLSLTEQRQRTQIQAMREAGTSHQAIANAEKRNALQLDAMSLSSNKAAAGFRELGVSGSALRSGNMNEIIREAADGLSKVQDPARRAALAQQLFGRSAQVLLPVLMRGSKGVDEMLGSAQKMGAYLPNHTAKLEKTIEAQRMWKLALDGLKITFTENVLPILSAGANAMVGFIGQIRSGTGVGGIFARAVSAAFNVVKGAVLLVLPLIKGFIGQFRSGQGIGGMFAAGLRAVGGALKSIGGALSGVVPWLKGMVAQFQAGNPLVVALAGALGGAAVGFTAFKVAATAASLATRAWAIAMGILDVVMSANPIMLIVIAIAAAVGAIVALYLKVAWFRNAVNAAWNAVRSAALAVWPVIKDAVVGVFNAIVDAGRSTIGFLTGIFESLRGLFGPIISAIINGVRSLIPVIGPVLAAIGNQFRIAFTLIKPVLEVALGVLKGLGAYLMGSFVTAFRVVSVIVGGVMREIGIVVSAGWTIVKAAFVAAWHILQAIMSAIAGVISGAFKIIKGLLEIFAGIFTLDFSKMWKGIKDVFSGAVQVVVSIVKGVWGSLKAAGTFIMQGLLAGIKAVWQTIKNVVGTIISSVVDAIRGVWNTLFNAGKFIIGGVAAGFKAAINAVLGVVVGFLNDIIDLIDKIPGVHIGHIGVPHLAQGGVYQNIPQEPGRFAQGGVVKAMGYFAGEEAPQHPEVIIATNPAYRQRNVDLWAQAGHMLGIPGFAQGGTYGMGALEQLWTRAGGPRNLAPTMAAIAEAESGGNPRAYNPSGASGLWQILGKPFAGNAFDPLTNARMAVSKYFSQGLGAWVTYTSGAYKKYLSGNFFDSALGTLGNIGKNLLLGALPGPLGALVNAVLGGGNLLSHLPKPPALPGWIKGLPGYVLGKVSGWIKDKITGLFGGDGGAVLGTGTMGLGRGHPTWDLITALANRAGLTMTSGYRPGGHSYHALGRARDYSNGVATRQELGFAHAIAQLFGQNILELIHTPLGWGIKNGQRVNQQQVYGAVLGEHYNHVHVAFRKGGIFGGLLNALGFAQGGTLTGGTGAPFHPGTHTATSSPTLEQLMRMPALPRIGGRLPTTAAGISYLTSLINRGKQRIDTDEHEYSTLQNYYGINTPQVTNPDTGQIDPKAVKARKHQLDTLFNLRFDVFQQWQWVVARQKRAWDAIDRMVKKLRRQHAPADQVKSWSDQWFQAQQDMTQFSQSRDDAWVSYQQARTAYSELTPKVTPTQSSQDALALTQQLLQQANLRYATSQAQYNVLSQMPPFGGSFQTGGIVPGPVGQPRTIIAHGGESVGNAKPITIQVLVLDGAVDKDKIRVIAHDETVRVTRGQARNAGRGLPGGGGG